jgi:hypothetical protein
MIMDTENNQIKNQIILLVVTSSLAGLLFFFL